MLWFSPGKLQVWTRWLQQQRQEIGCGLVELFVSKEVKAGEGKALLLRSSLSSACGAPMAWRSLLPQLPSLMERAVLVEK